MIVVVLAVAGAAIGVAWAALAPTVQMAMTQLGPIPLTELDASNVVSMDSWYAVLGGGAGLVLGAILATMFLRQGVAMVVALVVGALLAAVLSYATGSLAANGEIVLFWRPDAPLDTILTAPLTLHAYGYLLVWPVAVLAPVVPLAWLGPADERRGFGRSEVADAGPDLPRFGGGHVADAGPDEARFVGPEHLGTRSGEPNIHRGPGPATGTGPTVV